MCTEISTKMITFFIQRSKGNVSNVMPGLGTWQEKFKMAEEEKQSFASDALAKSYNRSERLLRQVTSITCLTCISYHCIMSKSSWLNIPDYRNGIGIIHWWKLLTHIDVLENGTRLENRYVKHWNIFLSHDIPPANVYQNIVWSCKPHCQNDKHCKPGPLSTRKIQDGDLEVIWIKWAFSNFTFHDIINSTPLSSYLQ